MLLRLLPEQISQHWEYVKYGIENSVPLEEMRAEVSLNNILESLLSSGMQCWWVVRENGDTPVVVAQVVTTTYDDKCSGLLMLRIYSLYGYSDLSMEEIKEGFEILEKYAKHVGCSYMDAFTDNLGILTLAERYKFNTTHYISRRL